MRTTVGCLFYGVDTDSSARDDVKVYAFPVGNPGLVPASVKVERRTAAGWESMLSGIVMPGQIGYLRVASGPETGKDYHIEGSGLAPKGYRITSDLPVVVYQINADDEGASSLNSGSTILIPAHSLGLHYFAIAPPDRGVDDGGFYGLGGPDNAFISVVGAHDGTRVTLTLTGATKAGGSVPARSAGGTLEVTINEGDLFQVETAADGNDLTGSEIVTDKPAAVFAGVTCGGFHRSRTYDCDHIEEQMVPVETWGRSFVVLDMRMPKYGPSDAIWSRIVASEDGTEVKFESPMPLPGLPTAPVVIDRGKVIRIEIPQAMSAMTGLPRAHYTITASKPVGVESFMGYQEGGAVVAPVDQFLDEYLISAHPYFFGHLMVTRKMGTPVTVDGMPLPDAAFTPAGAGFEVSYVEMPRCDTDLAKCGHRVIGAKIGVTVTANGGSCNYCYAGGAGVRCVNRTAGCL